MEVSKETSKIFKKYDDFYLTKYTVFAIISERFRQGAQKHATSRKKNVEKSKKVLDKP